MTRRACAPGPSREVGPYRVPFKSPPSQFGLEPLDDAFRLRPAHFFQWHSRSENEGTRSLETDAGIEWPWIAIDGQQTAMETAPVFRPSIHYSNA